MKRTAFHIAAIMGLATVLAGILMPLTPASTAYAQAPQTPLLGVDATSAFGCNATANNVRDLAKSLEATGLKNSGYNYIILSDCWQIRTPQGELQADPVRFPGGLAPLAASLHNSGIKLIASLDSTTRSCLGAPGSQNHYQHDARALASWGIDGVSISSCDEPSTATLTKQCQLQNGANFLDPNLFSLEHEIQYTNRPMLTISRIPSRVNELCGSDSSSYLHSLAHASTSTNSWDISPQGDPGWSNIINEYQNAKNTAAYSHNGAYGNAGVLDLGKVGLNPQEQRAQLALWSVLGSPLILGVDPARLDNYTLDLLKNPRLLSIDQNNFSFGTAYQVYNDRTVEVLARQLNQDTYVAVVLTVNGLAIVNTPEIPWGLPAGNWTRTEVFDGGSEPLRAELHDISLMHGAKLYTITHADN